MGIGDIVTEKKKQIDEWLKNQSTPVEIAAISAGSAVQGTAADFFFFGSLLSLCAWRRSIRGNNSFFQTLSKRTWLFIL